MKEPIESFAVGDPVQNTQQVSYYYQKVGRVSAVVTLKSRTSLTVNYDDGSSETFKGKKVWLRKVS
jgi:hypothetical protein